MAPEETRFLRLAAFLGLTAERLGRHVIRPLPPPTPHALTGWIAHEACRELLSIADGFNLFGTEPWNGFRLWGSVEYRECVEHGRPIAQQATERGLLPVYGSIPHLTSVSVLDGSVVSSDWENFEKIQHGWGKVIAGDLAEYIRTLIQVREAYGDDEGWPSDWWDPYASHGDRYDREQ
jgi:hypothetical protein